MRGADWVLGRGVKEAVTGDGGCFGPVTTGQALSNTAQGVKFAYERHTFSVREPEKFKAWEDQIQAFQNSQRSPVSP